jgi:tetratricopeptide (TPR) repeat protein
MRTRKQQRVVPAQQRLAGRLTWRKLGWTVGAVLGLGLVVVGVWYGTAPSIPAIRLPEEVDPAVADAVAQARRAIRWSPWSDKPRGDMGMLLGAHALAAEAAAFFRQAEELNPREPRWPYLHAFVVRDDPPQMIESLRRAWNLARANPDAPDAPLLKLADTCLENDYLDEAAQAYEELLGRRADHPMAHLGLARLALVKGQPERALAHLQPCLNWPQSQRAAHVLLAEVQRRRGDHKAAAEAMQQAQKWTADTPWPDPWLEQTQTLVVGRFALVARRGRPEPPRRPADSGTSARQGPSEDMQGLYNLGTGKEYLSKGRVLEAEEALRASLQHDPSSADAHYYLGVALYQQRRLPEAITCLERATELDFAYAPAYREWGRCAAVLGNRAEATERLRKALQYMPQDSQAHRLLGELLGASGDQEGARDHLQRALRLNPQDQRAQALLEKMKQTGPPPKP